ncbi:MAG: hypothetical protein Q8P67_06415, partial [archaeon]|nr:hypothetical protein [archaeon]
AWTTETAQEYKQEIGQWSEIYTGHYDDYRDTTYLARIQSDVSNRKSEMHFINRNSSFIYMDRENYDLYFIRDAETPKSTGYVHNSIIGTVLRIRTIQYFMQIVSKEIDRDQENLSSEEYLEKPPHKIKEDLERTSRMKNALQTMLSPVWTDIARSHRQHYHSVLDRVIFLSNLKGIWRNISDRIDANSRELNAIFLNKQEESSERQESILNTVNTLLGASIIFEIVSYVTADEDVSQVVNRYLSIMIIIIFVLNLLRLRQTARSKE